MKTLIAEKNIHLSMPPILIEQMEAAAEADGTTVDALAQNAVKRYLKDRNWQNLLAYARSQAHRLGLKSGDVPRLIAEARREHEAGQ